MLDVDDDDDEGKTPLAILRKSKGCMFCSLFNGDMLATAVLAVLLGGEVDGPFDDDIGVHVRPV